MEVMRCARRHQAIENGTFETLKSSTGYNFEHNLGHGEENLSSVFANLSMLAFLIGRIQEHCCPMFGQALAKLYLWRKLRAMFLEHLIPDWQTLWAAMAKGYRRTSLELLDGY